MAPTLRPSFSIVLRPSRRQADAELLLRSMYENLDSSPEFNATPPPPARSSYTTATQKSGSQFHLPDDRITGGHFESVVFDPSAMLAAEKEPPLSLATALAMVEAEWEASMQYRAAGIQSPVAARRARFWRQPSRFRSKASRASEKAATARRAPGARAPASTRESTLR